MNLLHHRSLLHLDHEGQRECEEAQQFRPARQRDGGPGRVVEGPLTSDCWDLCVQVQDGRQHEGSDPTKSENDAKLDGRVQSLLAAPDANDEIHRHPEYQFPEHIEGEQVDGQEGSQHAGLQQQHGHGEFPAARPCAPMACGESNVRKTISVVSSTSHSEMPSTPR